MFYKSALAAIALTLTALPAVAGFTYTSEPIAPDSKVRLDTTPVLIQEYEDGSTMYASRGFWSSLASDGNLYVSRIFTRDFVVNDRPAIGAMYMQIDCGRGQVRSLFSQVKIDGVMTRVDLSQWRTFASSSPMGQTCEMAASDRGIDWVWEVDSVSSN